ncbi:helix-turn-helix transcriptional regulator [Rodentibacter trehalosifermentans]|uniref:DNA-binding protein n=1 Tax=Rodentibacter trehalosifermentans TaxID=1908263 RepID=A0A1V3IT60_9PAST|nr:AlpA family transcriptional regulator [Rodentibacter trehalosifermentans]OOF45452.1 DNA-binding protein [Rodentibacter trehalosifermentans]OOF48076.1 DNA-binding protein [Rodentibacter trehalosifermentans]OOF49804.1 DNA-binding protein [Rodentibacter trehalosifermentans]
MAEKTAQAERFIKLPEVMNKTGLGRSTIYRNMKAGEFPKSIQLNKQNSVWLESEVNAWMKEQINKRNQQEINQ